MVVVLKKHRPFGPAYNDYLAASRRKLEQQAVTFEGVVPSILERKPMARELIPGEEHRKRPVVDEQ